MKVTVSKCVDALKGYIFILFWFSFTFCFFAPMQIFLTNMNDFDFSIMHLIPVCVLMLIFLLIFLIVIFLIMKKNTRLRELLAIIICIGGGGAYIQGNFLGMHNGLMDGSTIEWSAFNKDMIASCALWLVIVLFSVIVFVKYNSKWQSVLKGFCICLFLLEIVTLLTLFASGRDYKKTYEGVVTKKDEFNLSNEKNLIIVILDAFDSKDFENGLTNQTKDVFKDFTYFPDTMSMFGHTDPSIPQMVTGEVYKNDKPYASYLEDAFENSEYLAELKDNDWDVGLYISCQLPLDSLDGKISNIVRCRISINDKVVFTKQIYQLVAYIYAPYFVKKYFWFYPESINDQIVTNDENVSTYNWGNDIFYLDSAHIEPNNSKKTFRVYHLYGMHHPFIYDSECRCTGDETSLRDNYESNIAAVSQLLGSLKTAEIYDNSAIIVCADHGMEYIDDVPYHQNPLFLVKGCNEGHEFIVSDKKVSYCDLTDTYNALIAGKKADESVTDRARRFFYRFDFDSKSGQEGYLGPLYEMYVEGESGESTDLIATGVIYEKSTVQ